MTDELLFAVTTPIGLRVRVTRERWELIVTAKHPVMAGREADVKAALERASASSAGSALSPRKQRLTDSW